jgi:heme/copper-type cytochrome/quinol oxidase subunit 3
MQRDLVAKRKREEELALKNKRTGMTIFQISWIMAFVCLIFVNWQLRYQYASWPPPGIEPMNPLLPTIATVALLASVYFARAGLRAISIDVVDGLLRQWPRAIGLGATFFAIMVFEFMTISPAALETQYGVVFRLMTGFHGLHALVIGLMMIYVYRNARAGLYTAAEFWTVEGTAKLWYFVAVAWILFYIVLYWI